MLYINGTADDHWPGRYFAKSALGTVDWWAGHHWCDVSQQEKTRVPDRGQDETEVEHWRYGACICAPLEFFYIEGGGHSWPGSDYKGSHHCMDIRAMDEVLRFWREHAGFCEGSAQGGEMIVVLSPAKKLDEQSVIGMNAVTQPPLLGAANRLVRVLRAMTEEELGALMSISPKPVSYTHLTLPTILLV